jgi:hypothetical protein
MEEDGMALLTKRGRSTEDDEGRAAQELADAIADDDAALTAFFCSSRYDCERLGRELSSRISGPLIGCTTAGEIDQHGYVEGGLVGVSLISPQLVADVRLVRQLDQFSPEDARGLVREMRAELASRWQGDTEGVGHFALTLIDGLSMLEEQTAAFLHEALGGVPLIGGSAGDDLAFEQTRVFAEGEFISNAAVLCLVQTTLPFRAFKTQHLQPTAEKLVITAANPEQRRVMEIDGAPAAEVYAELLDLSVDQLTPEVFSGHPVLLRIGGESYVRSIQRVDQDGSLVFYCAIDNGLVLTLARGDDLVGSLEEQLGRLNEELGSVELVLGCDCILRRLEMQQKGLIEDVVARVTKSGFVGFSTYGEQFDGVHVNQTLTGVALGSGT